MSESDNATPAGPDLRAEGVAWTSLKPGTMAVGHVDGDAVVLVRKGDDVFAMGARCTHYGGPLGDGLFDGAVVRCPWHHACFRPETGEAVQAPAIDPVPCYAVERRGDRIVVGERLAPSTSRPPVTGPGSVLIVGGGAAGFAAAEMLRRTGYDGPVHIISEDADAPYDRPNLSKDFLAGNAPEDWMPLRAADWYRTSRIDLTLGTRVAAIDAPARQVALADGRTVGYEALLLATGASAVRLPLPGADQPHVHYLRSMRDSRAIIAGARAREGGQAVVVGASFIGLEVAASLVARKLTVHVVAPEAVPMVAVLGPELGRFVQSLHESHGVHFHLGQTLASIEARTVTLKDGRTLDADLVVMGVGVRPNVQLAEQAGLRVDRGVVVDQYLRTSAEGIWAAGDIARWPDPISGESIRVEHWVVAERQGQVAALNMLGRLQPYRDSPFFWSQHYDVPINYVGHAHGYDAVEVSGTVADRDCAVRYRKGGKTLAVATIYRDAASLAAQVQMDGGRPPSDPG